MIKFRGSKLQSKLQDAVDYYMPHDQKGLALADMDLEFRMQNNQQQIRIKDA